MSEQIKITVGSAEFGPDDLITIADCSKRLKMTRQSVQYYVDGAGKKTNELRTIKIAGTVLVAEQWLQEWEGRRAGLNHAETKVLVHEREQMRKQIEALEEILLKRTEELQDRRKEAT